MNKTTDYIIQSEIYEKLNDLAEYIELKRIIEERKAEKKDAVEVSLDDL
jgi:antitoxin StbD